MKSTEVKTEISQSQDGKKDIATSTGDFDTFLNARVDHNTNADDVVDLEELECDLNYMIFQLKKALSAISNR